MPVTIQEILDLRDNEFNYRYGLGGAAKRRPPQFNALVGFIRDHFAERFDVRVAPWGFTPFRKIKNSRRIAHTGQRRDGHKLEVWPRGEVGHGRYAHFTHKTCDPYRNNWDVVRDIADEHRGLMAIAILG